MHTTVAWYESIDPAGALVPIAGVPDDHMTVVGDDIIVPDLVNQIIGEVALINDASAVRAQVQSPSLRVRANLDVEPIEPAAVLGVPIPLALHKRSPIPLAINESVNFAVESDPAAPADHYGIVTLAEGPVQPVEGGIFSVRATGQNVGAAGAWTTMVLTFATDLPVGRYQVVGARGRAATGIAFRLIFVGSPWRPGFPVASALDTPDIPDFRYGGLGIWGEFHTTRPPQVEVLGAAGAVPAFIFDLIQV